MMMKLVIAIERRTHNNIGPGTWMMVKLVVATEGRTYNTIGRLRALFYNICTVFFVCACGCVLELSLIFTMQFTRAVSDMRCLLEISGTNTS